MRRNRILAAVLVALIALAGYFLVRTANEPVIVEEETFECIERFSPSAQSVNGEPLDTTNLVKIAVRHALPVPPPQARLVLAYYGQLGRERIKTYPDGGTSSESIERSYRDPGIYKPVYLLEEKSDGSIVVLRGTERETLASWLNDRPSWLPPWLPFSTKVIKPKLDGHVTDFDDLSTFVCAVQSAAMGSNETAQKIWNRFVAEKTGSIPETWGYDGLQQVGYDDLRNNPSNGLALCIFKHLRTELLREHADWKDIYGRMTTLLKEFPALDSSNLLAQCVNDHLTAELVAEHADWKDIYGRMMALLKEFPELRSFELLKDLGATVKAILVGPRQVALNERLKH